MRTVIDVNKVHEGINYLKYAIDFINIFKNPSTLAIVVHAYVDRHARFSSMGIISITALTMSQRVCN